MRYVNVKLPNPLMGGKLLSYLEEASRSLIGYKMVKEPIGLTAENISEIDASSYRIMIDKSRVNKVALKALSLGMPLAVLGGYIWGSTSGLISYMALLLPSLGNCLIFGKARYEDRIRTEIDLNQEYSSLKMYADNIGDLRRLPEGFKSKVPQNFSKSN